MTLANPPAPYVLGHSAQERERLQRQGAIYAEFTERVLVKAGVGPGQRVLDVGCGVGDVSLVAARLVGPTGATLGVDNAVAALADARARLAAAGAPWARFEQRDLHDAAPGEARFDALVGRFILLHLPDPVAALRALLPRLAPGARVAFIEIDLESLQVTPPLPEFDAAMGWIAEAYRRDGVEPNMGSRLFETFRAVGLEPRMEAMSNVEGGPHADAYDYLAETVRSLLPRIEALGVASAAQVGVDTLAQRLRARCVEGGRCIFYPRMVGAWARLS